MLRDNHDSLIGHLTEGGEPWANLTNLPVSYFPMTRWRNGFDDLKNHFRQFHFLFFYFAFSVLEPQKWFSASPCLESWLVLPHRQILKITRINLKKWIVLSHECAVLFERLLGFIGDWLLGSMILNILTLNAFSWGSEHTGLPTPSVYSALSINLYWYGIFLIPL